MPEVARFSKALKGLLNSHRTRAKMGFKQKSKAVILNSMLRSHDSKKVYKIGRGFTS